MIDSEENPRSAAVSVQTVYKAFGNKPRLAKAAFDVAMAGDDEPVVMLQRPSLGRVRDEPDPHTKFRLYGEFLAEVAPRHVPVQLVIRDAAAADPEARTVWAELQAERLKGMTQFAQALHEDGHLRSDVTTDKARDVLWTYNSAELFQLLVLERRWTPTRYGRWVADALTAALLPEQPRKHHTGNVSLLDRFELGYATTVDGARLAYGTFGDGPVDIVFLGSAGMGFEASVESPISAPWWEALDGLGSGNRRAPLTAGDEPSTAWHSRCEKSVERL